MRKFVTLPAALLAVALLGLPAAFADDTVVFDKLIKEKAPSVVSVKLVLAVKMSSPHGSQDQEINMNASGVVVDASGLVLLSDQAFDAGSMMRIPRQFRRQMEITSTPISIRVTFPGDTKEYDAVLGAKDSKLGLGFVMIKDLAGKQVTPVSLTNTAEPKLGQDLYGVTRLGQGFDFAPLCNRLQVAGHVTKPRDMWIVQGAGAHMAQPVYDASGAVCGIVVDQEGVGEEARSRPFLLPMKVAATTVANGLKKSKEELDRILEEEEEAAANKGDGEKKDAEGDKGDGEGDK